MAILLIMGISGCLKEGGHAAPPVTDLYFTQRPASGGPSSTVQVCWHLSGNGTANMTGVLTNTSGPSIQGDGRTFYPNNASTPAPVHVPGTFCTGVTLPSSGALWVSPYATYAGGGAGGGWYAINVS